MINREIEFDYVKGEIQHFLQSYPVTWIGKRPEPWQETKMRRHRQALSDALAKCDLLAERLQRVGRVRRDYGELLQKLIETKDALWREFRKWEIYGLGVKGTLRRGRFGEKFEEPRRPTERLARELQHYLGI